MSDLLTTSAPLHGPGGLLATPGMGTRRRKGKRWGMRHKDTQITGRLYRADDGKFSAGNGPPSDAPPNFGKAPKKPRKARGRKGTAKPKQTDEQRQQARDAKQEQNRTAVFSQLGLFEDATAALVDLRAGKPVTDDGGLVKMGLAERADDGSVRMTATGRAFMSAASAGDAGRARDTLSRGTDASSRRAQRLQERAQRQQAAAERRQAVQARRVAVAARRAAKKPGAKPSGDGDIASAMQRLSPAQPKRKKKKRRSNRPAPARATAPAAAPEKTRTKAISAWGAAVLRARAIRDGQ